MLIVGASVRAAAWSALRAGFTPVAIDCFADVDLARCCLVRRTDGSPRQIRAAAAELPAGPWMYTGGLENDPRLVRALSATRELLGNPPHVLDRIRDPALLAAAMRDCGFAAPRMLPATDHPPRGRWLIKHKRSSGGRRIRRWTAADASARSNSPAALDDLYLQQWVRGRSLAAVYVATGSECGLLGVTEQILGVDWTGGGSFQYAGSIGPLSEQEVPRETLQRLGRVLTERFQLRGLFGVDLIAQDDRLWVIEVNPRYTASVEVLERGLDLSALTWHVAVCRGRLPPLPRRDPTRVHGKAILFAQRDGEVNHRFAALADRWNETAPWPRIADLPALGSPLRAGHPVTTVFADAPTQREVAQQLRARTAAARAVLEC